MSQSPATVQIYVNAHEISELKLRLCHFRAHEIKCRNAEYPDGYGHYREARYTQTKHHWWWKANFVFSEIRELQNFTGERQNPQHRCIHRKFSH